MNHRHHCGRGFSHPRHGFGPAAHGGRGHRGGGPRRSFEQGELRWVILSLIAEKESHGYELIRAIEEKMGGAYSPSPGVIYPTLTLLEDLGYIAPVDAAGPKKAYAITPEGRAALEENKEQVEAIFARMDGFADRAGGGPSPKVIRAWENLRTALRLKARSGRLSEAQIAALAAALDQAAGAVESI